MAGRGPERKCLWRSDLHKDRGFDPVKRSAMPTQSEFPEVFEKLKSIIKPYSPRLKIKADTSDSYHLEGKYSEKWKNDLFFASTQIKKNYVSFYLMPVYMYPDLLKD